MKKIFLLAAASLALVSCDSNIENEPTAAEAFKITASIGESALSRAHDAAWTEGDTIGISSTVGGVAGPFINYKYITDGDGKFEGDPIFFYKPMTLTAYYPFTGSQDTAPGDAGVITANTGPDKQTEAIQPTFDFLWDSKTGVDKKDFSVSNPNVNFVFAHKMSKLSFTFISSDPVPDPKNPSVLLADGVDVNTMISYEIEGLGVDGTFDTATGICAIDESKGREGLKISFSKDTESTAKTRSFPALIVFPQSNDAGYTLHITTDELKEGSPYQDYKCALTFSGKEIKAGYHYQFKIQVSKRGLIVGDLSIEPWTESEKFITATIDGGNKESKE